MAQVIFPAVVVPGSTADPAEPASPSDGQIWIDTDGTAPTTVVTRWSKTPTNGTTTLSGTDDTTNTLAYTPGYEQVFLNGVLLSRGSDYTATTGTSVVLVTATVTSDIVEIIAALQVAYTDAITTTAAASTYVAKALTTTTGDIIYASAANTPARLGIGSSAQVLTVASGVPSWATPAGGGKVLQVVSATHTSRVNTSSTSFVDTGLTVSITPTLATSKVLVLVSQSGLAKQGGSVASSIRINLLRGATQLATLESMGYTATISDLYLSTASFCFLDSPSTTSATAYKTQFCNGTAAAISVQIDSSVSMITLLEIGV